MNYVITGIGKSQHAIFDELTLRQLTVKQVNYFEFAAKSEDLVFVIYDGLQIKECMRFLTKHTINAIPIFVDIDRIMIPGYFKQQEEVERVCGQCALARMQEYYFSAKMHEVIMSQENEFSDIFFLPEEISLFCDHLKAYINDSDIHHYIANFSFEYYSMIFKEISGYTNCPHCDHHDSSLADMRNSLEGGKTHVTTIN
ncbi:hypothetical protein ACQKM9_01650 [Viridibacillus sp. NPDC093762]|uniref:hypothetical protein n=1 Tax=Viridibacillus sp. NPDC093762 TaxID=3390720 RepID=UPI003D0436AF